MAITPTLQQYLADRRIVYDVVGHEPTKSSTRTAEASHVPGDRLAKGVLLRNNRGYVLAVLPASRRVQLSDLQQQLGEIVELADEPEIARLFDDCEPGAIPPVGPCYGLEMIVEDRLGSQPDIYFEAGDHATLIHVTQDEFAKMIGPARRGRFSAQDAGVPVH